MTAYSEDNRRIAEAEDPETAEAFREILTAIQGDPPVDDGSSMALDQQYDYDHPDSVGGLARRSMLERETAQQPEGEDEQSGVPDQFSHMTRRVEGSPEPA